MKILRIVLICAISILSVICVSAFFILLGIVPFNQRGSEINPDLASSFGTIYQGVFGTFLSLVSVLIVVLTILLGKEEKRVDDVENRVIKLTKLFIDTRDSIVIHGYKNSEHVGKRAFIFLKIRIRRIIYYVKQEFEAKKLGYEEHEEEIIDIAYLIFFFGFGREYENKIKDFYNKRLKKSIEIDTIITRLKEKHAETCHTTEEGNLAQYFRQLYNIVTYIDSKAYINDASKYDLVKLVRVQLSNQEQTILFYNSLSIIGIKWKTNGFIEKYGMIKNINENDLKGINIKKYYPKISLEIDD